MNKPYITITIQPMQGPSKYDIRKTVEFDQALVQEALCPIDTLEPFDPVTALISTNPEVKRTVRADRERFKKTIMSILEMELDKFLERFDTVNGYLKEEL